MKENYTFLFRKILLTNADIEKYPQLNIVYQPIEDEFSKSDMEYFMNWFIFFMVGFMEYFEKSYKQEFARALEYSRVIYGFEDNEFFILEYGNEENDDPDDASAEYYEKIRELEKKGIPMNENAENN